jgi:hypothetical protein
VHTNQEGTEAMTDRQLYGFTIVICIPVVMATMALMFAIHGGI